VRRAKGGPIAAEMTGRVCHAIEIAPAYVDVAVKAPPTSSECRCSPPSSRLASRCFVSKTFPLRASRLLDKTAR